MIGTFIVSNYGESWDEHLCYQYAENSPNANRWKSYSEATRFTNPVTTPNARIIVFGAPYLVEANAREDLKIEKYKKDMEIDHTVLTFAVLLSRYDKDIFVFQQAENIYIIDRNGVIFITVKQLH